LEKKKGEEIGIGKKKKPNPSSQLSPRSAAARFSLLSMRPTLPRGPAPSSARGQLSPPHAAHTCAPAQAYTRCTAPSLPRMEKKGQEPSLACHAPCLPHVPPSATTSPTSCSDGPFFSRVLCSSTTPALGLQSICAPAASLAPRLLLTFPETHVAKQIAVAQAQGSSTATGAERCESLAPLLLALPGRPTACIDLQQRPLATTTTKGRAPRSPRCDPAAQWSMAHSPDPCTPSSF